MRATELLSQHFGNTWPLNLRQANVRMQLQRWMSSDQLTFRIPTFRAFHLCQVFKSLLFS